MSWRFNLLEAGTGSPSVRRFNFSSVAWQYTGPLNIRNYDNSAGSEEMLRSDSVEVSTDDNTLTGLFQLSILIGKPVSADTDNFVSVKNIEIRILNILSTADTAKFPENKVEDIVINPVNPYDYGEVELLLQDIPLNGNPVEPDSKLVYKGGLWLDAAQTQTTANWTNDQGSGTLADLLKSDYSRQYSTPSQVLSITIYSKLLYPTSVLREINNSNKLFMIKRVSFDAKFGRWNVEAHQLHQGQLALQAEDGSDLLAEDGSTLLTQ